MSKTKNAGMVITEGRTLDHAAKIYDIVNPLVTFGLGNRLSEKAIGLLNLRGREKILDVGCGTGTLTIDIAGRLRQDGSSVIGLDAAPRMLEIAKGKAGHLRNIRFDAGAAERLPYDNNHFDHVISTFFFHHLNLGLKKAALEEMRRVLKKGGGAVIMDVDTPTNLFGGLCAYAGYLLFRQGEILENIKGKLKEIIEQSGFEHWRPVSRHLGYISVFHLIK